VRQLQKRLEAGLQEVADLLLALAWDGCGEHARAVVDA